MNERIRKFLLTENKSSAQLAEEIGVQPSGISHILSGRNNPSLDFILKMLDKYKFLSTDWLLFGKGSMYKESHNESLFLENAEILDDRASNLPQNETEKEKVSDKALIKPEVRSISTEAPKNRTAAVVKIVWFYSDNSFEEFYPGS